MVGVSPRRVLSIAHLEYPDFWEGLGIAIGFGYPKICEGIGEPRPFWQLEDPKSVQAV